MRQSPDNDLFFFLVFLSYFAQVRQFEVAHRSMWLTLQPLLALLSCRAEEVRIFGAFLLMALCQGLENRLLLLQEEERHFACLQLARFSRSNVLAEFAQLAMNKVGEVHVLCVCVRVYVRACLCNLCGSVCLFREVKKTREMSRV